MLLATTGLLVAIGLAAWLIGELFQYRGIGAIGSVIIIAVGAAIVLTGLEYRAGVSTTTETVHYRTTEVGTAFGATFLASLGIGGVLMILGALLLSQTLIEEV
jgi:hypothetical protein